jgi:hypothetical protein
LRYPKNQKFLGNLIAFSRHEIKDFIASQKSLIFVECTCWKLGEGNLTSDWNWVSKQKCKFGYLFKKAVIRQKNDFHTER